jgi:hypothetical protein
MVSLRDLEWAYEDALRAFIEKYLGEPVLHERDKLSDSHVKSRFRQRKADRKKFIQASTKAKIAMVPAIVNGSLSAYYSPRTAPELCNVAINFIEAAHLYSVAERKGVGAAVLWKLQK